MERRSRDHLFPSIKDEKNKKKKASILATRAAPPRLQTQNITRPSEMTPSADQIEISTVPMADLSALKREESRHYRHPSLVTFRVEWQVHESVCRFHIEDIVARACLRVQFPEPRQGLKLGRVCFRIRCCGQQHGSRRYINSLKPPNL